MSTAQIIFFLLFTVSSCITNFLWFRAKSKLRKRGLKSSLFFDHNQDLRLLAEVAATSNDPDAQTFGILRKKIQRWLVISFCCLAAIIIAHFVHVLGMRPQ